MKNPVAFKASQPGRPAAGTAFTLIEMLVVIGVIAMLAAMIFPAMTGVKRKAMLNKVQGELKLVETAIDTYKEKYNFYPPANPANPALNPLYFELVGTTNINPNNPQNPVYRTLDGRVASITAATINSLFGTSGFVNSTRDSSGEGTEAQNFLLTGLKPGQVGDYLGAKLLVCTVGWPVAATKPLASDPTASPGPYLNPWRYVSTGATNNPNSYDLWVDVLVAKKIYRISNWSEKPQEF